MAAIAADRDLLIGLLALQNGRVEQDVLILAFRAWTRVPSRPVGPCRHGVFMLEFLSQFGGLIRRTMASREGGRPMRASVTVGCRTMIVMSALGLAGCIMESHPVPTPLPPNSSTAPAPKPETHWVTYNPKGDRFSVLLPGTPEVSSQSGRLFTVYIATCDSGGARYLVTYFDPPPQAIAPEVVEATMKRDRDMSLKDIQGTLKKESNVTIESDGQARTGLESVMENAESLYTSRLYAVGGRMYSLQVVHPKVQDHAAEIVRFFDSFKVSGKSGA
jgi:hypothetical protein